MLRYPDSPPAQSDAFVNSVMQKVRRERQVRRGILFVFGLIGALFGLIGAMSLSGKITWLFTHALSGTHMMQLVLLVIASMAFYNWFMNDDLTLEN
jgi:hypothetical protein